VNRALLIMSRVDEHFLIVAGFAEFVDYLLLERMQKKQAEKRPATRRALLNLGGSASRGLRAGVHF
jgi:hypothetical protein